MKLLRELMFPLIAVLAAFIVGGILILIIGDNPIVAYKLLIGSALSWPDGIGYTLFYAMPRLRLPGWASPSCTCQLGCCCRSVSWRRLLLAALGAQFRVC